MRRKKSNKPHSFVLVEAEDWVGLYVDGKLVEEHHDLDLTDWLSKFGVNIKTKHAYNDRQVTESGTLPDNLNDVEFD